MQIDTEHLRLRPLTMADVDDLLPLQQDPQMMRYFEDGHVYTPDESRTWLQWHADMWGLEGYGFWGVELRATGAFVGWLGVTKVWTPPEIMPSSELGWFIARRHWGQGLATEGAREALAFAFGPLELPRVIARYHSDNPASGRVMEKIGMRFWREDPYPGVPEARTRIFEMLARP
ncbi:MAG: GNAT family N-acetyltransferase [Acidimicrobiales bacterium]